MTTEDIASENGITTARLTWLEAEARLAELLPSTGPVHDSVTEDLTEAITCSEQAHAGYLRAIRAWATSAPR